MTDSIRKKFDKATALIAEGSSATAAINKAGLKPHQYYYAKNIAAGLPGKKRYKRATTKSPIITMPIASSGSVTFTARELAVFVRELVGGG